MKKFRTILASVFFLIIPFISLGRLMVQEAKVNITGLLEEMLDREAINQIPTSNYQSKQASSYNRESVSPGLHGLFANSDGVSFERVEEINGKKANTINTN